MEAALHPPVSSLRGWVQCVQEALLGWVYPEICQVCSTSRGLPADGYLCSSCTSQLRPIEPPFCERCGLPYSGEISSSFVCANCHDVKLSFDFARSAIAAKGVGLDLIHRYKYHRALWLEPLFRKLLQAEVVPKLAVHDWDVIVPVPLHPLKEREREFNQAHRLALLFGSLTGLPVESRAVRRVLETRTQTTLSREQRAENVHNAFICSRPLSTGRRRVLLIDDVMTTGATTSECARALRRAGAQKIGVWTLARGL